MTRTNKTRRVNPNAVRTISPKGGHGLPSRPKKKKRKKVTATQMSYAPRRR